MKKVLIVGGGLAGLISGIELARAGIQCTIVEKKSYPFHRVCGEYVSNEVTPFLRTLGIYPEDLQPASINEFQLSSVTGKSALIPLEMGGFGISRFAFDNFLYKKAIEAGAEVVLQTEVDKVQFAADTFQIDCSERSFHADVVMGCFGKRSKLDMSLRRHFVSKRSPYTGVKYHIQFDQPSNRISLHNFPGGYCGISNVENNVTNLCYLTHRDNVRKAGNIKKLEEMILCQNRFLKDAFSNGKFLFDKPEVINEISFESKQSVEGHILMVGDSAGMIAPLCGNGMAMAIHSAAIASDLVRKFCINEISRDEMEASYSSEWRNLFQARLWRGRNLQKLFGNKLFSNLSVNLLLSSPFLAKSIVKSTHGDFF